MRPAVNREHWEEDDRLLDDEHGDVIALLDRHRDEPKVPGALDRRIKRLAAERRGENASSHWILGQGPLVILVTLILFSIALLTLWVF